MSIARRVRSAALGTLVTLGALAPTAPLVLAPVVCEAACPADGVFSNEMRWPGNKVTVRFNPKLDMFLEPSGQNQSAGRIACFQAAAAAWNGVIAGYGGDFQIEVVIDSTNAWAAERWNQQCTDTFTGQRVDNQKYTNTHPDGTNAGSTAKDVVLNLGKHGWVRGEEVMSDKIDARLAECKLSPQPMGAPQDPLVQITEADILWFTHLPGGNQCQAIPWDYSGQMAPQGYDYLSVMAHELGHLLGLGHQESANGDNVMAPGINQNQRHTIQQGEIDCLMTLYPPQAVPVETASWGKIKSMFD